MSYLFIPPSKALDPNANPYSGAKWYFYETGTLTPQSVFTTSLITIAHANPVVADSTGKFANIYLNPTLQYRAVLKNSTEAVTLHDMDPVNNDMRAIFSATGGSNLIGFQQAGVGAVVQTVQSELRKTFRVSQFGIVGTADDTVVFQAAITACPANSILDIGDGIITVGSQITATALSNVKIVGRGTIKGKASTDFQYLMDFTGVTDVVIDGPTFDANKAGRGTAIGSLSCIKINTTTRFKLLNCTFKNGLGTAFSSVAVSASGGCYGLLVDGCTFKDCGTSANVKPCDGIFVRGDYCMVVNCEAENITDSAYVMEGCNYSIIANVTGKNCTSIAWISNDTSADVYGNQIIGVSGTCNYVGSLGGIVGLFTAGVGKIVKPIIANINVRVSDTAGASSGGPMIFLFGNIKDARLDNIHTDPGTTSGKVTHAIIIDGADGVQITNSTFKGDGIGTCARLINTNIKVHFDGCTFASGGVAIAATEASSFTEFQSKFISCVTEVTLAGSSNYNGSRWQSWTPIYSSNIGNAAATFSATPASVKTTISRIAETVTVNINFTATLLAVSPAYIDVTVPAWATPIDGNAYTPANILNAVTYETGTVRTLNTGALRFYRANDVNFSSSATVAGRVSFSYEIV